MGAKIQAFDIFQTPLSSHYPLPLIQLFHIFLFLAIEEEAKVHFLSLGYSFEQECLSQFCFLLAAAFFIYNC